MASVTGAKESIAVHTPIAPSGRVSSSGRGRGRSGARAAARRGSQRAASVVATTAQGLWQRSETRMQMLSEAPKLGLGIRQRRGTAGGRAGACVCRCGGGALQRALLALLAVGWCCASPAATQMVSGPRLLCITCAQGARPAPARASISCVQCPRKPSPLPLHLPADAALQRPGRLPAVQDCGCLLIGVSGQAAGLGRQRLLI